MTLGVFRLLKQRNAGIQVVVAGLLNIINGRVKQTTPDAMTGKPEKYHSGFAPQLIKVMELNLSAKALAPVAPVNTPAQMVSPKNVLLLKATSTVAIPTIPLALPTSTLFNVLL